MDQTDRDSGLFCQRSGSSLPGERCTLLGRSWAFRHQASVTQVCKVATWSSAHTLTKFYKVDVLDASFGRKVLQAAV